MAFPSVAFPSRRVGARSVGNGFEFRASTTTRGCAWALTGPNFTFDSLGRGAALKTFALDIRFGRRILSFMPATKTPSNPAAPKPARIRAAIRSLQELPGWFPTVQKVLTLAVDPRADPFQLEVGLTVEPSVASRVLVLANSPYFGAEPAAETIPEAITALGHKRLRELLRLVLVSGLLDSLANDGPVMEEIRKMSTATAAAAYRIARTSDCGDAAELLGVGLLHPAADFALARLFPDNYAAMLELFGTMPTKEAERIAFGMEVPQIGRWLAEGWSFPRIYSEAAENWPRPLQRSFEPLLRQRLCAVHIAVRLADGLIAGLDLASLDIDRMILRELRLGAAAIEMVWNELPEEIARLDEIFSADARAVEGANLLSDTERDSPSPSGRSDTS